MSYEGEALNQCNTALFQRKTFALVVVSGARMNPCGHMLLNFGGRGGYYAHVSEVLGHPKYMDATGYARYLKENKKTELYREGLRIPKELDAIKKIEELLSKSWLWGGLVHNCADFIDQVVEAGGGSVFFPLNCPVLYTYTFKKKILNLGR